MNSNDLPKPKWTRWFRFNLRTFLVAVTLFCVLMGWYLFRVQQQQQAVDWIKRVDGDVWYEYQLAAGANQTPVVGWPSWMVDGLGIDYFETVVRARIYYAPNVESIELLKGLPNLKSLTLSCISATELDVLPSLPQLEELHLRGENFSDISPLAKMSNLESLVLVNTLVTDIAPVCELSSLNFLEIYNAPIDNVSAFLNAKRRFNVQLKLTKISDEDIDFLIDAWPGRISTR